MLTPAILKKKTRFWCRWISKIPKVGFWGVSGLAKLQVCRATRTGSWLKRMSRCQKRFLTFLLKIWAAFVRAKNGASPMTTPWLGFRKTMSVDACLAPTLLWKITLFLVSKSPNKKSKQKLQTKTKFSTTRQKSAQTAVVNFGLNLRTGSGCTQRCLIRFAHWRNLSHLLGNKFL